MTIDNIISVYCEHKGLRVRAGTSKENDPAPILPFLIADCAYQEFCSGIKPLEMHHNLKRMRKNWLANYHQFNQRLFIYLDAEQRDFVIELMDSYAEFIQNDVMLMRIAVMNLVKGCGFDDQKIIASLMLCNIFSQVAQIIWGCVYKTDKGHDERAPELDRMRNLSHKLTNSVVFLKDDINPNMDTDLTKSVDAYMSKTTKWLKNYDKE